MDALRGQAQLVEERAVFFGLAPEVDGVGVEAVLAAQQGAGDAGAAAQVEHGGARLDHVVCQQLLAELERVGAHDLAEHELSAEASGFWEACGVDEL